MGRGRGGSRTQRRHFRQNRENVWKRTKPDPSSENPTENNGADPSWQPFATQNPAFEEYYKEQGIVAPEEWDLFMEYLRKPLPAAFRINSSSQFCSDIRTQLESDFMISLQSEVSEGGELQPIRPLAWYPENLAWHSNFSRMQLRKNQTLERFHEFLKLENEIGNITRQEAVSMVPPLFLDVRPEHFILDMCAAPGSKTFQLLEIIHRSTKPGHLPDGLVVANDLDVQRCNLLIHQTKRMCTANLIVTNNEAQHFPGCRSTKKSSSASEIGMELEPPISQLLFDRVLCDVPCSGDGTLRKAPDIWRKWHAGHGNGLHALQVQIAMRGLSLLKVGGRMVYSTCSMNPVENEAVIGEILRKCGGSVELVDVSSELPQLVRRPGLKKWKVRDKGKWLASSKDVGKYRTNAIGPGMFPSGRNLARSMNHRDSTEEEEKHENGEDENVVEELQSSEDAVFSGNEVDEEVSPFPLERCMRIVPHDQNGGAFFVAVLHKHSPLPANQGTANLADETNTEATSEAELIEGEQDGVPLEPDISIKSEENGSEANQVPGDEAADPKKNGGKRKQLQGKWKGVDPVVLFKDEAVIDAIKTFYGIDESFPFNGHLVTRNNDTNHVKRIYYVSKAVKDALDLNFYVGEQLKIASVGLKMFERQTASVASCAPCAFRISSEGLPLILPYITKQILHASPVDFKHILQYKSIKFSDFVDAEFGAKASNLMLGCCVLVLSKDGKFSSDPIQVDESTIAIGCWKGQNSLSMMVTALDCQELLERLLMRIETGNGSLESTDEASNGNVDVEMEDMQKNGDKEMVTATEG
ncbi:uncharacterized protein LOC126789672 [Argentina anserina]|uniref:uncharacterized protein LOC126789672 n=1 Tax=Argentina anserina TaxID=57926 RepID=UPI00217659B7|nr:uncharacterized protein LOC126789672 [Potentilla anserina]